MLTKTDLKQIEDRGLTVQQVYRQLETFSLGIPTVVIVTAATIGNGIEQIPKQSEQKLIDLYERKRKSLDIVKFVPASGAATRMFKFLHEFIEEYHPEEETFKKYVRRTNNEEIDLFFGSLSEFAFNNEVRKRIRKLFPDFKQSKKGQRCLYYIRAMMEEQGLNFANLPKGLIPFHKYTKYYTTAFEEQLYEAAFYATSQADVYTHFTFSEKHVTFFEAAYNMVKKRLSKRTKSTFHISYSFQKKSTDTIAVDPEGKPFRDEKDALVFRPSGHGALLDNLNEVDADIVFVKNIDNVVATEYVEEIAYYKKLLAGKLLWLQQKIFSYLEYLIQNEPTEEKIAEIRSFMWNELSIKDVSDDPNKLIAILNRPVRVCGLVRNTGQPGGGAFWVKQEDGDVQLQIVELSQIDLNDSHQQSIVSDATHFNPVDIVCGLRDHKGKKFDLMSFSDPLSGFISEKSIDGKPVQALELPGLWNGGMAYWNSAFVEVPLSTFNPVKTVNDLLKNRHRPNV